MPPPESSSRIQEHAVAQGERLDYSRRTTGDPEQFWRICDANAALDPTN